MRIFLVFLTFGFLTGLGEANIGDGQETNDSHRRSLVTEEYCQDRASINDEFPNLAVARRGCCSHHKGVCGCQGTRQKCCDGTLSPSCKCFAPASFEESPSGSN